MPTFVAIVGVITNIYDNGAAQYISSVQSASNKSLEAAISSPSTLNGGATLTESSIMNAKGLAQATLTFRSNAIELIQLLSPDTPVFSFGESSKSTSTNQAGARNIIAKYSNGGRIPVSFLKEYARDVGKPGSIGRGFYGKCIIQATLMATYEALILVANGHDYNTAKTQMESKYDQLYFLAENLDEETADVVRNNLAAQWKVGKEELEKVSKGQTSVKGTTPSGNSALSNKGANKVDSEVRNGLPDPEEELDIANEITDDDIYHQNKAFFREEVEAIKSEVVLDGTSVTKLIDFNVKPYGQSNSDISFESSPMLPDPVSPIVLGSPGNNGYESSPLSSPTGSESSQLDSSSNMFQTAWSKLELLGNKFKGRLQERIVSFSDDWQSATVNLLQESSDQTNSGYQSEVTMEQRIGGFFVDSAREKLLFDNPEMDTKKELWNMSIQMTKGLYVGLYDWSTSLVDRLGKAISTFGFDNGESK